MHGYNMYDSGARFHTSNNIRFISMDPLAEKYYAWSSYAYCMGNPVRYVDPDGRFPWPVVPIVLGWLLESQPVNAPTLDRASNARNMQEAWNSYNEGVLSNIFPGAKIEAVSTRAFVQEPIEEIVYKAIGSEVREDIGKTVPNPNGKKGGQLYQDKVKEVMENLKNAGYEKVKTETKIRTQGGSKNIRYMDAQGTNPTTGETKNVQVGRKNKNGTPVSRERKALDDVERATGKRPEFIPYN